MHLTTAKLGVFFGTILPLRGAAQGPGTAWSWLKNLQGIGCGQQALGIEALVGVLSFVEC